MYWSDNGEIVVLACETSFYVLRYNRELVQKHYDQGIEISDQGMLVHRAVCCICDGASLSLSLGVPLHISARRVLIVRNSEWV